jgi:hypothetical protein
VNGIVVVRHQAADRPDVIDEHENVDGKEWHHDGNDHEVEASTCPLGSKIGEAVPGEGRLGRLGHLSVAKVRQDY